MKTSLLKHIRKNIPAKRAIVLAFSGGPDSVYLFHQLKKIQKSHPFTIILAHFNHKLRGKDSDKDEKFCELFAKKHNAVIEIEEKNIAKEDGNIEDAARKYRYKFLHKIRNIYNASFIITAHHLDDNIETFLMNFLRGSGLKGLSCMQVKSSYILRPMLEITKEEILSYLKKHSIKFCIDKTNFDESCTRNNIRKNIVPLLKKIQPSLNKVFLRNWETLSQTQKFLDKKSYDWVMTNVKQWYKVPLKTFNSNDPFLQTLIIRTLFNLYHGTTDNLSRNIIQRAQKIINEEKTGKKIPFGQKTVLIVNSDFFEIIPKTKVRKIIRKKLTIPGETKYTYGKVSSRISKKIPKDLSKRIYIDYSKCKLPLYIRGKKDGDLFKNMGMKGTQKLQDFFVNKKIPSQKRKIIPLIVDKNDQIIAVGNTSISDTHKITKYTKEIISISFKPSLENNQK